jgi:hypothetical protein
MSWERRMGIKSVQCGTIKFVQVLDYFVKRRMICLARGWMTL